MSTTTGDEPIKLVRKAAAEPGDYVSGMIAQRTRRGLGWGTKRHVAIVDHRYGPHREMVYVRSLCGRNGKLDSSSSDDGMCRGCSTAAERLGIKFERGDA